MHMPALRLGGFFLAAALFGACTLPNAEANKTRKLIMEGVCVFGLSVLLVVVQLN